MHTDGWGVRFHALPLPRAIAVTSCFVALCCSELNWLFLTAFKGVPGSTQTTDSWFPALHAAAWSTEGFADEGEYIYETQETSSQGSSDEAHAASISAGATALMHASHPGVDPYGGALEQNDIAREDLVPSLHSAESRLQQIAQEEADMAVDDLINDQRHDLPCPEVFAVEPQGGPEMSLPAEFQQTFENRFSWGPEVPQSKYAALERLAETFGLREEEREALPAFQAAASLLKYLEETFGSWDVLLRQSASSSNQLFPSFFVLNKREEDMHKHLSQQEQRNRVLLAAQAAFLVYPLIIHLYKAFPKQPRPVQRSISAIAAFLNGKELLLVPAAIVPMDLYLQIAGDELPESTTEEADKKTRARAEISSMLRGYSLRVLDSSQPQSPLMQIDKKALQQLSTPLMAELADPLEPRPGNWLQVSRASAEKMTGFRLPAASLANSLQIIQQAREMSQSVGYLTRLNGSAMVKAYKEIEELQNAEARVVAAAAEAHAHPGKARLHAHVEVDAGVPPSPVIKDELEEGEAEERAASKLVEEGPPKHEPQASGKGEAEELEKLIEEEEKEEEEEKKEELNEQAPETAPVEESDEAEEAREESESAELLEEEAPQRVTLGGILKTAAAAAAFKRPLEEIVTKGKEGAADVHPPAEEKAGLEEEEQEEEAEEQEGEALVAAKEPTEEHAEVKEEKAEKLNKPRGVGVPLEVARAAVAFKRPLKRLFKKGGVAQAAGELEGDLELEEAEEKELVIAEGAEAPTKEPEKEEGKKPEEKQKCRGLEPIARGQESLFISNLQAFAEEYDSAPEETKPLLVRKAAAALRDAEMRENGIAWMDSYDRLIAGIQAKPDHDAFAKQLKDDLIHTNKLEAQLLQLSENFAKQTPMDPRWEKAEEQRSQGKAKKRKKGAGKKVSFLSFISRETHVLATLQTKGTSKKERKHVEGAAKLLLEIAERTLMGQKTLQLWAECCNMNEAAKTAGRKEWGGDPAVTQSLDTRLMRKALKIIKKQEGQKKQENKKQFLKKLRKCISEDLKAFEGTYKPLNTDLSNIPSVWRVNIRILNFARAGECLLENGFLMLSFRDREEVLSLPSGSPGHSFVSLQTNANLQDVAGDTHTAMLQLHDSSGAKRRKNRKRKHPVDRGADPATNLALRQRVALDEVFAYTHLIGGIYSTSLGALSVPGEREGQLQQMETIFAALEEAKEGKERKSRAAELAEKAILVTILPPHQYLWALYSGIRPALRRFAKDQENKSLLSAFRNRAESLCLSPRRVKKVAEAAMHDPAFFGQLNEVKLAVQEARKQALKISKKARSSCKAKHPWMAMLKVAVARALGAEKALGGEIAAKELTPDVSQLEKTVSARLAQQALGKMHAETIDLLLSSLETHKYRRILANAKKMYLSDISKEVSRKSQRLADPRHPETLNSQKLAALLLFLRQRVAPRLQFDVLNQITEAEKPQGIIMAVALVVDQLSRAADTCLSADLHLLLSLSPLLLQLIRADAHEKGHEKKETACLLATYFPASSPFRPWLTGGHGAFVLRRYGGKEVVRALEAKQREMEKEGASEERPKKKKKKTQGQQAQQLEAEYVNGLLMDPMRLPFELEQHFTAEQFYSIFTKHDGKIKKAVAAREAPPPANEVRQTLGVARAHFDTVRGCRKTGHRMLQQLQALLGNEPAVDVILHYAETQKKKKFRTFFWRILMEAHAKKNGRASDKLTSKLYRLSVAHLQTKKATRRAELIKAAVDACRQYHSPPDDLEDFFFGNNDFYLEVVEAHKSPSELPGTHRDFLESAIDVGRPKPFRILSFGAAF
ncbi:hypothetical protein Esti_002676 [Eimeria stiedai]